jgi:2-polyprenyl-3-methyl-5-hydroxy-6-metoxy-1,4-benzoquinol methylase
VLPPLPREVERTELLDCPDAPPEEIAASLADLARLNRLGPIRSILACLGPLAARAPRGRPLRILDVGAGGGDLAVALARWGRRVGRPVHVIALDLRPAVLRCAAARTAQASEVRLVAGDALALPCRPGAVDLAVCALLLHHLPEEAVVRLLAALAGLVRLGFVVSDLRRGRWTWAVAWLVTRALSRHRVTRHDGPLSVRRAYTPAELRQLAERAGVPEVRWRRAPALRVLGVWARPRPAGSADAPTPALAGPAGAHPRAGDGPGAR